MSSNAVVNAAQSALAAHSGPVPSKVRADALGMMDDVLDALHDIATGPGGPKGGRGECVAAAKLIAEIAAVRATTSVPRDVVDERLRQTAEYLRTELGDARFATMADTLTRIWNL